MLNASEDSHCVTGAQCCYEISEITGWLERSALHVPILASQCEEYMSASNAFRFIGDYASEDHRGERSCGPVVGCLQEMCISSVIGAEYDPTLNRLSNSKHVKR